VMGRTWKSHFRPRWAIVTVLIALGVLGLTHIPGEDVPRMFQADGLDKVEHIVAYGLIMGSFILSLQRPVRPLLLGIGLAVLAVIAALDETTQPLVHRTASIWDWAGDLTGMAIPCTVFLISRRRMLLAERGA
jgi:VanZ family protein